MNMNEQQTNHYFTFQLLLSTLDSSLLSILGSDFYEVSVCLQTQKDINNSYTRITTYFD